MEIRRAEPADLPAIIELMKISLGEELMPKSEEFFCWKHERNVFGPSYSILATENNKIIGLRTFMKWKWSSVFGDIMAVRAVDTATHPDHQGRGIFRKLTMQAVEDCTKEGLDIVFNSPNPISKPGYLKMGWESAGKLPLWLGPGSLVPASFSKNGKIPADYDINKILQTLDPGFSLPVTGSQYSTPISFNYLQWRFAQCPVAEYGMVANGTSFGFVFRLKPLRSFIELRICEVWYDDNMNSKKELKKSLHKIMKAIRPLMISCAHPLPLALAFGPFNKGPEVTVRSLSMNNLSSFKQFSSWNPSIGSLEIF